MAKYSIKWKSDDALIDKRTFNALTIQQQRDLVRQVNSAAKQRIKDLNKHIVLDESVAYKRYMGYERREVVINGKKQFKYFKPAKSSNLKGPRQVLEVDKVGRVGNNLFVRKAQTTKELWEMYKSGMTFISSKSSTYKGIEEINKKMEDALGDEYKRLNRRERSLYWESIESIIEDKDIIVKLGSGYLDTRLIQQYVLSYMKKNRIKKIRNLDDVIDDIIAKAGKKASDVKNMEVDYGIADSELADLSLRNNPDAMAAINSLKLYGK